MIHISFMVINNPFCGMVGGWVSLPPCELWGVGLGWERVVSLACCGADALFTRVALSEPQ